jgi:hypothetical protein
VSHNPGSIEPSFKASDRPSKLGAFADKLSGLLKSEAQKSRKQKRTVKQLYADLISLGYDGSYGRVAAFARDWKVDRQREQQTSGRGTFVPLVFQSGEAFQFDGSDDWAILRGNAPSCRRRTSSCRIAGPLSSGPIFFKPTISKVAPGMPPTPSSLPSDTAPDVSTHG